MSELWWALRTWLDSSVLLVVAVGFAAFTLVQLYLLFRTRALFTACVAALALTAVVGAVESFQVWARVEALMRSQWGGVPDAADERWQQYSASTRAITAPQVRKPLFTALAFCLLAGTTFAAAFVRKRVPQRLNAASAALAVAGAALKTLAVCAALAATARGENAWLIVALGGYGLGVAVGALGARFTAAPGGASARPPPASPTSRT